MGGLVVIKTEKEVLNYCVNVFLKIKTMNTQGKKQNYLKSLSKELRENAPEMHEKGFFESLYDFGVETYYEYIDPNWGLRK